MITAQYPGECSECESPIQAGQQIETDDWGKWRHVDCPEPEPVCPACWTVHAGPCV